MAEQDEVARLFARLLDGIRPAEEQPRNRPLQQFVGAQDTLTISESAIPAYLSAVLTDLPSGYWRLGEGSGVVAVDSSGNGRNGTYSATGVTLGQTGLLTGDTDTAAALSNG